MTSTDSSSRQVPLGEASPRWHNWVATNPIAGILLIGVIATQLGTYFGYVFPAVGLPVLPWPLYNGILGTTLVDGFNGSSIDGFVVSSDSFWVGHWGLHFVNGIVFTVLYAFVARPMMRPFPYNNGGHVLAGLSYGTVMAIMSAGWLVPYAYVPNQGYGFFMFDGPDGWKLPFAILVWHLIYGAMIGLLWQPKNE
jgi:hypothetical protein